MNEAQRDLYDEVLKISGVDPRKCMVCGKCSGSCPAYNEMEYHPHQFVTMVLKGQIEKLAETESIWNCLSCFACVERCPRSVRPAKLIEGVRLSLIRKKGEDHLNPRKVTEIINYDENIPQQAITSAMRKYNK